MRLSFRFPREEVKQLPRSLSIKLPSILSGTQQHEFDLCPEPIAR